MKKKILSLILIMVLLIGGLFALTGCENGENGKTNNTIEISRTLNKGKITLSVPKKDDGTPKYEFTEEKPENSKVNRGTFYLVTDNAVFSFKSSGLVYNTSVYYKQKYGDQKATFDGYLDWVDDKDSKINLSGMEKLEINGRKAIRYYDREGSSGNYKYYGYFYSVGADDVFPGSDFEMTVTYKSEESEAKEFDEETLSIINSLKIELNQ